MVWSNGCYATTFGLTPGPGGAVLPGGYFIRGAPVHPTRNSAPGSGPQPKDPAVTRITCHKGVSTTAMSWRAGIEPGLSTRSSVVEWVASARGRVVVEWVTSARGRV